MPSNKEERYSRERTAGARLVEREAFGHDVGLNGYTSIHQAQVLREHLRVNPGDSALEVGAGHGWPGWYVIESTGCRLVSTDIPRDALRQARTRGTTDTALEVAAADGRALPFRSDVFQGIIHADVFC